MAQPEGELMLHLEDKIQVELWLLLFQTSTCRGQCRPLDVAFGLPWKLGFRGDGGEKSERNGWETCFHGFSFYSPFLRWFKPQRPFVPFPSPLCLDHCYFLTQLLFRLQQSCSCFLYLGFTDFLNCRIKKYKTQQRVGLQVCLHIASRTQNTFP